MLTKYKHAGWITAIAFVILWIVGTVFTNSVGEGRLQDVGMTVSFGLMFFITLIPAAILGKKKFLSISLVIKLVIIALMVLVAYLQRGTEARHAYEVAIGLMLLTASAFVDILFFIRWYRSNFKERN